MNKFWKEFLQDNWYIPFILAGMFVLVGPESKTMQIAGIVLIALAMIADVGTTTVLRSVAVSQLNNGKDKINKIRNELKKRAANMIRSGSENIKKAGQELENIANEIED